MEFTFGILAYNQEKMILETLESIKYQIVTYGKNHKINIIIVDDFSRDCTQKVICDWIEYNKDLFNEIIIQLNERNLGTVINYNFIMDNMKTNYFKVIAGDDIFCSTNIFDKYENLQNDEIKTYVPINLIEKRICIDEDRIKLFFYNKMMDRKNDLKLFRRGCFFHTPSTIHTNKLYKKSNCKCFNSQFVLFEDDPTWYSMIKNSNPNIDFINDYIVLYRIHSASVSNVKREKGVFENDQEKLLSFYLEDAGFWEKILLWFRKHDNLPKIFRIDKYCNWILKKYINTKIKKNIEYINWKQSVERIILCEQEFYNLICENAKKYKSDRGNDYASN